jgi:undecaprenyl-diphosphatase
VALPATAAEHAIGTRRVVWALLAVVAVLVAIVVAGGRGPELTVPKAALLGAVEGITEFLPVSSTGHLLVVERLLGLPEGVPADTYAVAIQLGAIAAVVLIFWSRVRQLAAGLVGRDAAGRRLLVRLVVAFVPAALVGAVLEKPIKDHLFRPWPIVVAWIFGGVFLLVWRQRHGGVALSVRGAALIGLAQVLALWPGASRSLVTIAAALAVGCSVAAAVEFTFLLGLATLGAATAFDLARHGGDLVAEYGVVRPAVGGVVALLTALIAVRWFIDVLRSRPLSDFGWYRIAVALLTVGLIVSGRL